VYFYGFRYYDPARGRWESRDPVGERGGANLYLANRNALTVWVDPLGTNPVSTYVETPVQDPNSTKAAADAAGELGQKIARKWDKLHRKLPKPDSWQGMETCGHICCDKLTGRRAFTMEIGLKPDEVSANIQKNIEWNRANPDGKRKYTRIGGSSDTN
jgi:uncharacterized protein RhaS with RHS repeats